MNLEEMSDFSETRLSWVVLSHRQLMMNPDYLMVGLQTLYTDIPDGITLPEPPKIWECLQELLSIMVNDEEFDTGDLYGYPKTVEFGVLDDETFFIFLDNGHLYLLDAEEGEPEISVTHDDIEESLNLTRIVMANLPAQYAGKDLMFSRPLYISEAEGGKVTGQLVSVDGTPKVKVVCDIEGSHPTIFEEI